MGDAMDKFAESLKQVIKSLHGFEVTCMSKLIDWLIDR